MLEDKKILGIQNRQFIDEYLKRRGISQYILQNPRYQSILWKISNMLVKGNKKANSSETKELLDSILNFDDNGNIIFIEGVGKNSTLITCKYYIDELDGKLKQLRVVNNYSETEVDMCQSEYNVGEIENYKTVSEYNNDGLEECLSTEQATSYGKYFSKVTRFPNRPDIIKIERIEKIGDSLKRLDDVYQIRSFQVALEDIYPTRDEIDPFDTMHFSILGLPKIYIDLTMEEQSIILKNNGRLKPLPETERMERFKEYKRLNALYARTTAFEKGMAKALFVRNRDFNE